MVPLEPQGLNPAAPLPIAVGTDRFSVAGPFGPAMCFYRQLPMPAALQSGVESRRTGVEADAEALRP